MAIRQVVFVGDSITGAIYRLGYDSVTRTDDVFRTSIVSSGVDFGFRASDYAGYRADQIESLFLQDVLDQYAGEADTAICVMAGTNEYLQKPNYSTWTQTDKDNYTATMTSMSDRIIAAGHDLILCPIWYVDDAASQANEDNGTRGLNEELLHPLIQSKCPTWWDSTNSRPVLYEFYDSSFAGRATLYNPDGIHPNNAGSLAGGQWFIDAAKTIPGFLAPHPGTERVFLTFNTDSNAGPNVNVGTLNSTISTVVNESNEVIPGASIVMTGFAALGDAGSYFGQGRVQWDVDNSFLAYFRSIIAGSDEATIQLNMGVSNANREAVLRIRSRTNSTSDNPRVGEFTVGGTTITIDASTDQGTVYTGTIPLTLDANGSATLTCGVANDFRFGYTNALRLDMAAPPSPGGGSINKPLGIRLGIGI
jgi:hypothetical protein